MSTPPPHAETPAAKPVSASALREQAYFVFPNDLNANDTVFGGLIMAQMDRYCAVVADRHAQGVCVTVGVDAVHFIAPARRGDVLIFNACVNRSWNSSMEVGCKVDAEKVGGGERRHILSAYLTFIAVDAQGKPRPVPAVLPETAIEKLRYDEAQLRREQRLRHAAELEALRAAAAALKPAPG
ncbi:MAG TPA: acyl-CoA thioesterase [Nevskiaceae bacterium]|nr:acyl-CoA thioesterase [Nevskiaceae bacterium]